jgi:hypothetical protein
VLVEPTLLTATNPARPGEQFLVVVPAGTVVPPPEAAPPSDEAPPAVAVSSLSTGSAGAPAEAVANTLPPAVPRDDKRPAGQGPDADETDETTKAAGAESVA